MFTAFLFPNPPPVDGSAPLSTLIQNTNGLVYGTTASGGPTSCSPCQGVFFSVATGDAPFVNLEPTQKTGLVGASIGMFGQGFSSASVVKFGGVASTSVTLSGTTYLKAKVPAGALTGAVTVTTGLRWSSSFTCRESPLQAACSLRQGSQSNREQFGPPIRRRERATT